jgi:predicted O-methyltransferase YrrM
LLARIIASPHTPKKEAGSFDETTENYSGRRMANHNPLAINGTAEKITLKSVARRVLPEPVWQKLKVMRIMATMRKTTLENAWRHAEAEQIPFMSGLGDASNLLYGLVRSMKPSVCVEIGSARGRSTCSIGLALKENGHGTLYAIDPHVETDWNDDYSIDTYEALKGNITVLGLTGQVQILRAFSEEVARSWNSEIDLLFIDGDHSYDGVKRDWELFARHLSPFGIAIFHDTIWDLRSDPETPRLTLMGVPRFVDELREKGYPVLTIDKDCGTSLVQPVIGGVPLRSQESNAPL